MPQTLLELPDSAHSSTLLSLSVEQFHDMRRTGILGEDEPVELLDGLLVHKDRSGRKKPSVPVSPLHVFVTHQLRLLTTPLEDHGCHLRTESPITIPPRHEPEPDGVVVRGAPRHFLTRHPEPDDVLSVIEVADSSLTTDRGVKQAIYAAAGIGQYVIVNLVEQRVEVNEDPEPAERCYGLLRILHTDDSVSLRVGDDARLAVAVSDWLP